MSSEAHKENFDVEIVNPEEKFRLLIPPGEYYAQCVGFKEFIQYGVKKLALTWNLAPPSYKVILIPQFFNLHHEVFKENSFYYEAWVIANHCKRPGRKTREHMSPKIFQNIVCNVLVTTVKAKFENGKEKPSVFHYSKIQRLLSLLNPNDWRKI